ncbi:hypothetical protein [Phormidium sp. FACHB-1136]|uniref:hypothetical protein n=1 Tax=Phormidium sp. FACHB-1136 TaxID=2692848 RepID=UPI001687314F|nr:hypothetical protein [Phormidium sp. FACHB-1136]
MVNPSALGVAFLVLLATTTMVDSSSSQRQPFQISHPALGTLLSDHAIKTVVGSYQPQTNLISLQSEALARPQWLSVQVPEGVTFRGTLAINGVVEQQVASEGIALDLRAVLAAGQTEVMLEGGYTPSQAGIIVAFDNPDTTVRQQVGQQGRVHYQIKFQVD